jgi:hypothetical protein
MTQLRRPIQLGRLTVTDEFVRYAVAVLGLIMIGMFTKRFVAFTWGPLYFVTVLEILPRMYRRLRFPHAPRPDLGPAPAPEP